MPEARCRVCRRGLKQGTDVVRTDEYTLSFAGDVCGYCCKTLSRALSGITELLRQSHGERRERVIDRLASQLKGNGFDVGDVFSLRRRAS